MRSRGLCCAGARIYYGDNFSIDQDFLEGRTGISYNFRLTERGLLMSVDKTATAFIIAGPLLSTIRSICGRNFDERTGTIGGRSLNDVRFASLSLTNSYLVHCVVSRYSQSIRVSPISTLFVSSVVWMLRHANSWSRMVMRNTKRL